MHPVITLLLATSVGWSAPESKDQVQRFVAVVAAHMVDAVPPAHVEPGEPPLTLRDVRFYFDALVPEAAHSAPLLISYDWRLPYLLTKP